MKHILVIGGGGFIGYNFIKWMNENHPEILLSVFDLMNYAGMYKCEEKIKLFSKSCICKFFNKDINNSTDLINAIFEANKIATQSIDTIVNFAAQTHVDNSLIDPSDFWKTNIQGAINVATVAVDLGIRLHHVSTDEVYGSVKMTDNVTETFNLNPSSPYSASKASADLCLMSIAKCNNAKITISRCSNNYGPLQHPEKLIPKVLYCIENNKQIPVYGNGLQVRDWIHAEDHSSAIYTILEKGSISEIYNISGDTLISNIDLINLIIKEKNASTNLITHVKDRINHDVLYHVNDCKIRALGWKPIHNIKNEINSL